MPILVPDFVPYLLAVLGLLFIWQLHHMQVVAGRIEAKSFWDKSGTRLFIHVTPEDEQTCPACREANGTAVLPSVAVKKSFAPLSHGQCTNPAGCRCQLIGLRCTWSQSQRLLSQVMSSTAKRVKLSSDKFDALLRVSWAENPKAKVDLVAVSMIEAIRAEGKHPETAVSKYRIVVDHAQTDRDLELVLPAYFRMLDILERGEHAKEALAIIDRLEKQASPSTNGRHRPTAAQLETLSLRKTRLTAALQRGY